MSHQNDKSRMGVASQTLLGNYMNITVELKSVTVRPHTNYKSKNSGSDGDGEMEVAQTYISA